MVVKLLLLLTFLKLFDVAASSGWMLKPLIPLNYFWCYLSLIDRKVAVLFLKNLLHNVYNTLIVQVLFLIDQYLMVHWWQDLLLLWCWLYLFHTLYLWLYDLNNSAFKIICIFSLWLWYRFLLIFETLYVNDLHVNRSHLNTLAHRLNKGMQIYLLRQWNSFPYIFEILLAHWKVQMGPSPIRTSPTV